MLTVTSTRPRRTIGKTTKQKEASRHPVTKGGIFGVSCSLGINDSSNSRGSSFKTYNYNQNRTNNNTNNNIDSKSNSSWLRTPSSVAAIAPLLGGRRQDSNSSKGGLQTLLAISRQCRLCGKSLGPMEAAVHACEDALNWPHGGETIQTSSIVSAVAMRTTTAAASNYRIVRVSAAAFPDVDLLASKTSGGGSSSNSSSRSSANANKYVGAAATAAPAPVAATFQALWQHVQTDFSHGFDPPPRTSIESKNASVLLALRGRRVAGLLWVERISGAHLVEARADEDSTPVEKLVGSSQNQLVAQEPAQSIKAKLGVVLIWSQRAERRKGLGSLLLDVARSSYRVDVREVAFSQTTHLGSRLAQRYVNGVHGNLIPEYHPDWM
mmetsp:Transcript_98176/g.204779  ORF Transcript_98176/g.204779 Transcript_98176/m.204779 type:complete len:381 (+) Transcript_98176:109-1251(+)